MNKYLEKIAEIQKEAMRVEDLANIAKKVGLRREGDWRGLARQFADSTGALKPARERAAIREKITGVSNNAIQQVGAAQRKLRQGDEVSAFLGRDRKIMRVPGAVTDDKRGILPNKGMALLNPKQDSDGAMRQMSNGINAEATSSLLVESKGRGISNIHTHPFPSSQIFRRPTLTTQGQELERLGDTRIKEFSYRKNLPVSSLGGGDIAAIARRGSPLKNKAEAHYLAKNAPEYDASKLRNYPSEEFDQEFRRFASENEKLRGKLSPVMKQRMAEGVMGDVNLLPFISRRNTILGGDKTLGVHTQPAINRYGASPITAPYWSQQAYFDVGQGGHKAIRRMLKKGIKPEEHGLDTTFTR